MNGKQHQLKNKDYEFGTWNVRTLFKPGVTKSLLQQLKDYRIKIAAVQETKWKENGIMDLKSHLIFYSGKEIGKREFGVAFVVDKSLKNNNSGF
jgi:exonuclease III